MEETQEVNCIVHYCLTYSFDLGALVVQEPCGHFAQVGVVSWGLGCAEYPGVYSRVTEKLHWIQANIKGQTCPPPSQLVN